MEKSAPVKQILRFGIFEVDLRSGELRKNGFKVRLSGQPFDVLAMLLERTGDVVTREELQQRLWPEGTFVDFDHNLNTAINKIREALGDSAENPRFVETLARRGYRFIAPIEKPVSAEETAPAIRQDPALIRQDPALPKEQPSLALSRLAWRRNLIWIATLIVIGGGVLTLWLLRTGFGPTQESLIPVPLATAVESECQPSFSPDGNQVAFVVWVEGENNSEIVVKFVGSEKVLYLTSNPALDLSPAWSPDGRSIAFLRNLPEGRGAVMLVPPIGGAERKLAEIYAPNAPFFIPWGPYLAWSPDSNQIVIIDKDSPTEPFGLFLLSVETGEKRRLTTPPANEVGDGGPAFSPEGRKLVFSRNGTHSGQIFLLSLSERFAPTGEPRQLTFDNRDSRSPVWSSNGRDIIYSSGNYRASNLWKVSAAGTDRPQRLSFAGLGCLYPAISHHRHRLAYTQYLYDTNIWRVEVPGLGNKSSKPKRFISSTYREWWPQFSPDGKKVAFSSDRSGSFEIWLCDSDGSNPIQLTKFGSGDWTDSPRWSPDSERIAFQSTFENQHEIYVISANGGKPQRLTINLSLDLCPSWSRDGKWIYFASDRSGELQVWKISSAGGKATQVTRQGGYEAFESADGKTLFYSKSLENPSLWSLSLDGEEESPVQGPVPDIGNFALVDEGVFLIRKQEGGFYNPLMGYRSADFSIQFLNFADGRIRNIAPIEKLVDFGFSVSPDRKFVLYTQVDQIGSDLMLVENFQ